MGAQDTTDAFFELLNADSRDEALKLMEERVEMRIHVGEGVQMLKGLERVGGWFLRADKGLRMIPGEIKDTVIRWSATSLWSDLAQRATSSTPRSRLKPGRSRQSISPPPRGSASVLLRRWGRRDLHVRENVWDQ